MLPGARQAGETLAAVGHDADAPAVFAGAVMDTLSHAVPFDGYCLFGMDPLSGIRSFMYSRNGLDGVAEQLAHNELVERDLNRYHDLAASRLPIGVMSEAEPQGRSSPRLNDMLRPCGFGSELRLVLRASGFVFGGISLFRETGARPFSDADVDETLRAEPGLHRAVRRHPVRRAPAHGESLATGVLLVDSSDRVVGRTAAADRWLDELCIGGADEMAPADHLRMVLEVANAARTTTGASVCRIRTASGRWLLVEAAPLDAPSGQIAVTLRTADLTSLLPAAAAWWGLTGREREVLTGLGHGLAAQRIARGLALAVPTVNAHLQSIYRKAGVTGREELLASLR